MSFLVSPVRVDNVSVCCGGDRFVVVDVGRDNDDREGNGEDRVVLSENITPDRGKYGVDRVAGAKPVTRTPCGPKWLEYNMK